MARMYPNELDMDTESPAEKRLYQAFRDGLDNSYVAFHSVAWQAIDANRRTRDGEADFVIAHPKRGVLVLEVKGGGIVYDARAGKWYSRSGDDRLHVIKDPFTQAKTSKYVLSDLLARLEDAPPHRINLGHAVAFPDVTVDQEHLGPNRPREIILDQTDLGNLSAWVGRCLGYWRGELTQRQAALTEAVLDGLMEILGKSWELRPKMWGEFQIEQEQFITLTREQYLYLDFLNRHRRAAICGCAGSGKTMLAVEKATRLAKQGFKTLLTCFNKTLALDLRLQLSDIPNLEIIHFHELCHVLAEKAEMLPERRDDEQFYNTLLPEALVPAAEKLGVRYQAIIVDEGQDFKDSWWLPLQLLLEHPDEGILYIFYDDNQRIYVPSGTFPIDPPHHALSVNCRNTQMIHAIILGLYRSQERPTARGPQGRPVEVHTYRNGAEMRVHVHQTLERLRDEGVPAEEMAVLTLVGKRAQGILNDDMTTGWPPEAGKVYCSTVHAFKGLERSVIILAGIEQWMLSNWQDIERLLYVGSSRARNHLVVVMSENAAQELGRYFTLEGNRGVETPSA
jgi:hypothetical protein